MNLPHYNYLTNDFQNFEFYSEGPRGRIKKMVVFSLFYDDPVIYNLAFGDEIADTGQLSDKVVSNNGDRDVVLATVANTIHEFCNIYGNHFIYATGSTAVRTRLYQISISAFLDEISTDFEVYGVINGVAEEFSRNVNYEAFLVKRR